MATAAAAGAADGGGGGSVSSAPPVAVEAAAVEAVAAEWMLEFACSCLCRHFAEQGGAEFRRWKDVAQALINGLSQIPPHLKKTVYLCQLLIRIAQGKSLGLQFENDQRISPLESALSFWTLLEREENKLDKLHEDIRRLIQIQIVAVHMENRYFKEAAEVLERLFTDSESDKPLRVKLATVVKTKDPYVPLLQSFSYSLLISKIKSYIKLSMKENKTNFLIQEATKHVVSQGLGATALLNRALEVNENDKSDLQSKQRLMEEEQNITSQSSGDIKKTTVRRHSGQEPKESRVLQRLMVFCAKEGCQKSTEIHFFLNSVLDNLTGKELKKLTDWKNKLYYKMHEVLATCKMRGKMEFRCHVAEEDRWTYKEDRELKLGVREFGVGNWAKILAHGNFNNRTSVMLKDRWRTLSKIK